MGRIHDSPIGIFDANWWIGWALVDDMGRGGAKMSSAAMMGAAINGGLLLGTGGPTLETANKQDLIGKLVSLLPNVLGGCKLVSVVVS